MLEKMYQAELSQDKTKQKESMRHEVAQIFENMYRQQKSDLVTKCKREARQNVVDKSIIVGLEFIQLWVELHDKSLEEDAIKQRMCQIVQQAHKWGKVTLVVAEKLASHMNFLLGQDEERCHNLSLID